MGAGAAEDWTHEDVRAQLARMLRSPEFERNRSVSNMLSFVVEETLQGRGSRLKAYTIGSEIFAREGTFDAQNNSIVRVQAARLRQLLEIYYTGVGADDPVHISMPVGGYKVVITKALRDRIQAHAPPRDASSAEEDSSSAQKEAAPQEAVRPEPRAPERGRRASGLPLCAAAAAVLLVLLILQQFWPSSQKAGVTQAFSSPTLSVKIAALSAAHAQDLERLADAVERGLGAFDDIDVILRKASVAPDSPDGYRLFIDAAPSRAGGLDLVLKLVRARDGVLVWSKEFLNTVPGDEVFADIAAKVSQAVGDVNGAVNLDRAARIKPWSDKPSGHACLLAGQEAIRDWTPARVRRAETCLEAELAADPEDANAQGLLAAVLVRRYLDAAPGGQGAEDLSRALRLARQAYDHDSRRARAAYTLFLTQFYDGRYDEAFAAALKAMEINPNATVYAAQIGAAYISRGDFARGEKLIARMEGLDRPPPAFLSAYLALAALMRNDDARFQRLAEAPGMETSALGLILRTAAARRRHDAQAEALAAQWLRERFPGVASDIPAALRRYALTPDIVARVTADLQPLAPAAGR